MENPTGLHDLHNDYPLAPESLRVNRVDKLIPNLYNKTKYVIHCENLKQYESLGIKTNRVHRGIKFEESPWLKKYIDLNTSLRAKAANDFEKDFFKLMNNSVFGKTIENSRKRVNIKLITTQDSLRKLAAKPNTCRVIRNKLASFLIIFLMASTTILTGTYLERSAFKQKGKRICWKVWRMLYMKFDGVMYEPSGNEWHCVHGYRLWKALCTRLARCVQG